jgi:capsular polysaccharide biosynthesis protein
MFQDRNGVISIECTASSPNEALSKTKMAHEQIIMLFGNTENNNLNEYLRDVISIHDNIERSILEISPPKKHVDDKSQKVIVDDLIHNKLPQIQFNHWSLLQKIIKLENAFNKQLPPITIMEPTVDVKPIRPNYMRNYLFSIIFGIFCGILYVFIGYAYSKR